MTTVDTYGNTFLPEDDLDESLGERIMALGEMFPESVRNGVGFVCSITSKGVQSVYGFSRTWSWILFSSAAVVFTPVLIQTAIIDIEDMAKAQQRQMLLGTNPASYPR